MKVIFLITMSILFNVTAAQSQSGGTTRTDYQCQQDCLNQGYMMGYCKDRCSYNTPTYPSNPFGRVDLMCQQDCLQRGYMMGYCKELCAY